MSMSWFLDEIERRLEDERQSRRELESEVARLSQMLDKVASMAGAPRPGGDPGGGAWAAAATVAAGSSEELAVYEVRTAGDVDKGERTVHNRYDDDTDPLGGPLVLVKNPDGSYLVVGQGCVPPE